MGRSASWVAYALVFLALAGFFAWVVLQMAGAIPQNQGIWRVKKLAVGGALVSFALLVGTALAWRRSSSR